MLGWSGFVIGLAGLSFSAPQVARAEHDEHRELHSATHRLELSMTEFAEMAFRRRLPPSDLHAIRTAKALACKLDESAHDDSWRTIVSAYTHLRTAMTSIDRRLHANYRLHGDHRLWNRWAEATDNFENVRWYLEQAGGHRSHRHDDWDGRDRDHRYWNDTSGIGSGYEFNDHGNRDRGDVGLRIQIGSPRTGASSGVRVGYPWRLP
jgi:hypothetical protein